MQKQAFIGATALLSLCGSLFGGSFFGESLLGVPAARADWLSPILGGKPILPTRFVPFGRATPQPLRDFGTDPDEPDLPAVNVSVRWSPLVDRVLTPKQKDADLSGDLQNAILRIEPIYDPTRLDGPAETGSLNVSAGTASTNNVFADRWRMADSDPNVNLKVAYIAHAWQETGNLPCDAFVKNRPHVEGLPDVTPLSEGECRRIRVRAALGVRDPLPNRIVAARLGLPVFAAPMPGSRMSSQDFWASQRARIAGIEASLHARVKAHRPKGHETTGEQAPKEKLAISDFKLRR